jgi:hypothetical protein
MDLSGIVILVVVLLVIDLIIGFFIFMQLLMNRTFPSAWIIPFWPVMLVVAFIMLPFEAHRERKEMRRNGHLLGDEYKVLPSQPKD